MKLEYKTSRQNGVNQMEVQINRGPLLVTTRDNELTPAERDPEKLRAMIDGRTLGELRDVYGQWYSFTLARESSR